jgi:hypothetical protein
VQAQKVPAIIEMRIDVFGFLGRLLAGSCRHSHYTFPMSARREIGTEKQTPYVVCLDCAKRFPYDWEQMRVIWTPEPSASILPADGMPEPVALPSPAPADLFSRASSWISALPGVRLSARLWELLRASLLWPVSH